MPPPPIPDAGARSARRRRGREASLRAVVDGPGQAFLGQPGLAHPHRTIDHRPLAPPVRPRCRERLGAGSDARPAAATPAAVACPWQPPESGSRDLEARTEPGAISCSHITQLSASRRAGDRVPPARPGYIRGLDGSRPRSSPVRARWAAGGSRTHSRGADGQLVRQGPDHPWILKSLGGSCPRQVGVAEAFLAGHRFSSWRGG
jgi:hypothetical protein